MPSNMGEVRLGLVEKSGAVEPSGGSGTDSTIPWLAGHVVGVNYYGDGLVHDGQCIGFVGCVTDFVSLDECWTSVGGGA
ncbi:hypothetical protein Tco_0553278 [Tanacetum coccineum]